ncbi:MAG: hypothetical protein ACE5LA_02680 [Dehalococcoidales bacterium]
MNKALLTWNLVLTLLLVGMIVSGCVELDPKFSALKIQVDNNRAVLEQLANVANSNRATITNNSQAILANKIAIESLTTTTEASINALDASLRQYVEQYVEAYVAEVTSSQ